MKFINLLPKAGRYKYTCLWFVNKKPEHHSLFYIASENNNFAWKEIRYCIYMHYIFYFHFYFSKY